MGSVAKSYMRKSFLIYEEMLKYLTIYEEAVSHIWICNSSLLDFLIYEEIFFFSSVQCCGSVIYWPPRSGSVILLLWIWSLTIYRRFKKFKKKVQLPVWQHIFTNGHKNIEVGYVCGWSAKNYPPGSVIRGHRSKDPDKYLRIPTLVKMKHRFLHLRRGQEVII